MSALGSTYQGKVKRQPTRKRPLGDLIRNVDDYLIRSASNPEADGYDDAVLLYSLTQETREKVVRLAAGLMFKQQEFYPLSISNFGPKSAVELILRVQSTWHDYEDPIIRANMVRTRKLITQWVTEGQKG